MSVTNKKIKVRNSMDSSKYIILFSCKFHTINICWLNIKLYMLQTNGKKGDFTYCIACFKCTMACLRLLAPKHLSGVPPTDNKISKQEETIVQVKISIHSVQHWWKVPDLF